MERSCICPFLRLQNFWTKCPEVERRAYEVFITQAVGSTLIEKVQTGKEVHHAGGNNTKNDCFCNQDHQIDRQCAAKGDEDISGAPQAQGAFPWEDFREKAGRSGRWGEVHRGHG